MHSTRSRRRFAAIGSGLDTATGTADAAGTGRVTSSGGNPSTLDLSMSANAQLANALGTSTECRRMSASIKLDFQGAPGKVVSVAASYEACS